MKKLIIPFSISAFLLTIGCNNKVDSYTPPMALQITTFNNHDYLYINNKYTESTGVQKDTSHTISSGKPSQPSQLKIPSTELTPRWTNTTVPIYVNGKKVSQMEIPTMSLRSTPNRSHSDSDIETLINQRNENIDINKRLSKIQPLVKNQLETLSTPINRQPSTLDKSRLSITIHDIPDSTI